MFQIAIIEDEKEDWEKLEEILLLYQKEKGISFQIRIFNNGLQLKYEMDEGYRATLYLVDIEMEEMDGIKTAAMIRELDARAYLIFVSRHPEMAAQGINSEVFRFVEKSEMNEKLPIAMTALQERMRWESRENEYLVNEYAAGVELIYYQDILYLKKDGKYVRVVKRNGESRIRASLKQIMDSLDEQIFAYADKGLVINTSHVIKTDGQKLVLRNGKELQMSMQRAVEIRERVKQRWMRYY